MRTGCGVGKQPIKQYVSTNQQPRTFSTSSDMSIPQSKGPLDGPRGPGGTRGPNFEARLKRAVVELNEALQYDYVVINADRTEAVADVAAIIDAESRRTRNNPELNEQLGQLGRDITAMLDKITKHKGD